MKTLKDASRDELVDELLSRCDIAIVVLDWLANPEDPMSDMRACQYWTKGTDKQRRCYAETAWDAAAGHLPQNQASPWTIEQKKAMGLA